jgi:hypothetical protein
MEFYHKQSNDSGITEVCIQLINDTIVIKYISNWSYEGLIEMLYTGVIEKTVTPHYLIFNIKKINIHVKPPLDDDSSCSSSDNESSNDSIFVIDEELTKEILTTENYYWELIHLPITTISDDGLGLSTVSQSPNAVYNISFDCVLMRNNNTTSYHGGIEYRYTKLIEKIDKVKFLRIK